MMRKKHRAAKYDRIRHLTLLSVKCLIGRAAAKSSPSVRRKLCSTPDLSRLA
jgi:hypothetical protein